MGHQSIIDNLEDAVLQALDEITGDYEQWAPSGYIAHVLGIKKVYVATAALELRNKGFATFARGLFDEEMKLCGSGYQVTRQGHQHLIDHKGRGLVI
jgi:hypothetical protein